MTIFFITHSELNHMFNPHPEKANQWAEKICDLKFDGCVEAIEWLPRSCKFVASVRDNNYLHFYDVQEVENANNESGQVNEEKKVEESRSGDAALLQTNLLMPYLKCNVNAFGDDHISFNMCDLKVSKDGNYLFGKTDQEKCILFVNESQDQLRTYYGAHSDPYSYSRIVFSKSMKYIYASHQLHFVVWNAHRAKILYRIKAHEKTLVMFLFVRVWIFFCNSLSFLLVPEHLIFFILKNMCYCYQSEIWSWKKLMDC
ncbi:hypothetical protein RFI_24207 [Reticulomyxa filosa]|uniref:Uncharacterized protein n=1 Tax=Reticulomyxa filosa TaxID=46433 RepID=X6MGM4_RETFI|nr:hypothetical protein RFI_24207 [Reticulomyxa filosa]|eukprot:ETO13168.1 hypothetical protein RFI_24207 [Reticulomyxa filosa]